VRSPPNEVLPARRLRLKYLPHPRALLACRLVNSETQGASVIVNLRLTTGEIVVGRVRELASLRYNVHNHKSKWAAQLVTELDGLLEEIRERQVADPRFIAFERARKQRLARNRLTAARKNLERLLRQTVDHIDLGETVAILGDPTDLWNEACVAQVLDS